MSEETTTPPLRHYGAICPHDAGFFQAEEVFCHANDFADAWSKLWAQIFGGRYISRVYREDEGKWVQIWEQGEPHPKE